MNSFYYNKTTNKWEPFGYNINLDEAPIGAKIDYSGNEVPEGYLKADGSLVKKADYPELFDIIGYTYGGSGDEFKLPDLSDSSTGGSVVSGVAGITAFESDENMWDYMEDIPVTRAATSSTGTGILSDSSSDRVNLLYFFKNVYGHRNYDMHLFTCAVDEALQKVIVHRVGAPITGNTILYEQGDHCVFIGASGKIINTKTDVSINQSENMTLYKILAYSTEAFIFDSKYLILPSNTKDKITVYNFNPTNLTTSVLYEVNCGKFDAAFLIQDKLCIDDKVYVLSDTKAELNPNIQGPIYNRNHATLPFNRYGSDGLIIIETNTIYDSATGKKIIIPQDYNLLGFLGYSNYVLVDKEVSGTNERYIFDAKNGSRLVYVGHNLPLNIKVVGNFAYLLYFNTSDRPNTALARNNPFIKKIPTKFLTGNNFKGSL